MGMGLYSCQYGNKGMTRDCARGGTWGHKCTFCKMTPNFEFLATFRVIHDPLVLNFGEIPEQVMTLKVCILTSNF